MMRAEGGPEALAAFRRLPETWGGRTVTGYGYDRDDLEEAGAKEAGKLRLEGKEYIVREGDVMHFRFNV